MATDVRRVPQFRERFAQLRGEMTQAEFAKFLGIARPTVGFYENGDRIPDAEITRKICERCGVTSDWLLGMEDCKTHQLEDLQAATGLSAEACTVLSRWSGSSEVLECPDSPVAILELKTLSFIIEHGQKLLADLGQYLFARYSIRKIPDGSTPVSVAFLPDTAIGQNYRLVDEYHFGISTHIGTHHLNMEQINSMHFGEIMSDITVFKEIVKKSGESKKGDAPHGDDPEAR